MSRKWTAFLVMLVLIFGSISTAAAASSTFTTKGNTSSKVVSLTFDDGSDGTNISKILNVLDRENVTATFFLTGSGANAHPESIRNIVRAGHEIANHSYSHPDFTTISPSQMRSELSRTESTIRTITGQSLAPLFRAPFGAVNSQVLQVVGDAGYTHTLHWNIDTLDWQGLSSSQVYNRIMSNMVPGSIVLMHTGVGASGTTDAISRAIPELKRQGYSFATVSQILGKTQQGSTHRVQAGDTLYSLAIRYGTTVNALVTENNISNVNALQIGQVLVLPGSGTPSPTPSPSEGTYTVKSGDTMYSIARRYNVTVSLLASSNNIANPSLIRTGQVLKIPGTGSPTTSKYTVKSGDTLYRIAVNNKVSVSALASANSISSPYLIFPGQTLTIPR
ncbi:LysM peptidoglycan-binding domain-containing protein [Salimicrobium flavidum]|uniref:Peptidoglycan/xylan/chitin deacetylase, PgdA/CDA1 family n=1 Tax=Salimicrobium flavidum TaxID=570947 RepID=A0A1N7JJC4_9BACI|nr:LysM peptidoglycan-binding domain-containing protein [Salimicrobium flavidum]SIS49371.1 Peptidoglycan/xylan/chitin deacetylase, PgdA/CDA1 family [Salimicrobium flavidum]